MNEWACRLWLQLGSNVQQLEHELQFLKQTCGDQPMLQGSVFLPNNSLLSQMSSRPWSGVYLDDNYLSSVQSAEAITVQVLRLYMSFGVVPLFESRIETTQQYNQAVRLLNEAHAERPQRALCPMSAERREQSACNQLVEQNCADGSVSPREEKPLQQDEASAKVVANNTKKRRPRRKGRVQHTYMSHE